MFIRWFGTRYGLRVPAGRPFTAHEIRLARVDWIGPGGALPRDLNPKAMIERGELFRGAIEDRYVGAFAGGKPVPDGRRRRRAPIGWRRRLKSFASPRCRATRIARFPRVC